MTEETVPALIDCARVLHYAIAGEGVRYTPKGKIFTGGVELGAVPRLAIVRNLADDEIMLLHCDEGWASLGVSGKGTVEDVMVHANARYEGLAEQWRESPYSDAEFAKAVADAYRDERCSFCGRYHFQTDGPMVGGDRATICRDCVNRLHAALAEYDPEANA